MSTVTGRVERGVPVVFQPVTITSNLYDYTATSDPTEAVSNETTGQFSQILVGGIYEVSVSGQLRWLIDLPSGTGAYDIGDVVLKDISRVYVRRDGDTVEGTLLIKEPDVHSSPRQAATVGYVKRKVAEPTQANRFTYVQAVPASTWSGTHTLGYKPTTAVVWINDEIVIVPVATTSSTFTVEFGANYTGELRMI